MKIVFLTSFYDCPENTRLTEEATKLGHEFHIVNTKDLNLHFSESGLTSPEIEAIQPDVIIARSVLVGVKPVTQLLNHLHTKGVKFYDNHMGKTGYSINKISDYGKMALDQIPLPNTFQTSRHEQMAIHAEKLGYPVIIKPIDTGKGIGVDKVDSPEQMKDYVEALRLAGSSAKRRMIQEFIPYIHDLRVMVIGDFITAMERIPQEGDFRANFSLGGSVKPFELTQEIKDLAKKAANAIGLDHAGVDVLITQDGKKYILEANHSPGFEGLEKATGHNIAKIYLEHALANLT